MKRTKFSDGQITCGVTRNPYNKPAWRRQAGFFVHHAQLGKL